MKEVQEPRINFDGKWKAIIETIFQDCLAFFLPELYKEVDFTKPITFLSQDAFKIDGGTSKKGDQVLDVLAKVQLKNGEEKYIYIHIEIERGHAGNFSERMFDTHFRIRDKHGKDIVALAIFLDDLIPKSHNVYHYKKYETEIIYKYHTYCVRDQKDKIELLKKNPNPFAIAVLAVLYVNKTSHKDLDRKAYKWQLIKLALERNYSKIKINALLNFLEHIVVLTPKHEQEITHKMLSTYHEKLEDMEYSNIAMTLINAYSQEHYGDTVDKVHEKLQKQLAEVQEVKEQVEEVKKQVEEVKKQVEEVKKQYKRKEIEERKKLKLEAEKQHKKLKLEAEKQHKKLKLEVEKQHKKLQLETEKKLKLEAEEKKRLELEKNRAKQEKEVLENKLKRQILKLHQLNYSVQEIVDFLEFDEGYVKEVLDNHSKE